MFNKSRQIDIGLLKTPVYILKRELLNTGGYEPEEVITERFHMFGRVYDLKSEDLRNELGLGIKDSYKVFLQYDYKEIKNGDYIWLEDKDSQLYEVKYIMRDITHKVWTELYVEGVRVDGDKV